MNTRTSRHRLRRPLAAASALAAAGLVLTTGVAATAVPRDGSASGIPAVAASAADTADGRSSFILPVLPDTQFYSRYSASQFVPKYGTNPFEVQTDWIVEHQDELDMPFTVHVGDVVDQEWVGGEWDAADKAMDILTAGGMPYSVIPGNHDVENQGARSSQANADNYRARFGASAMAAQAGNALIGTHQDGLSSAYLFEAEGRTWMSLALAWNASDDTFDWAQSILDAHPGVPVILSSHAIINIAQDQVSPAAWWWGDLLWDRLIRGNDQIILTVNGHFHGATKQTRVNDFGHEVHQVLADYQMAADGGNGIMPLFEFDLSNGRIDVETVSPWVTVKHEDSLTSSDTPVLDGTWQSFSMEMDFSERFGWQVDPALETGADLSERAKEIVSEGWEGDDAGAALQAAGRSDDYPVVDGTVAHWRFGSLAEGVIDENTSVPDVAGNSPLQRNPIDETDAPEELADLTVTHENTAYYSADAGASCFTNVYRNASGPDRLSFLTTEYGAPATFADLTSDSGYTIETFLQLDEEWTEAANRWSAALTRGGVREWVGINDSSDPGAGVSWLGISNLREYQFSAADTDTSNSYTLWSGEIMPGSWHHVAIVNDPSARTVIMYIDGVPVLRNASDVGGMVAADYMPWMLGTSTWNSEPDHGWHGCIGETRIIERALDTDQFLYNRVDIDGDGSGFSVSTDLSAVHAPDAAFASFSGTGHPGAAVRLELDGEVLGQGDVDANGAWTIELVSPLSGSGTYGLSFIQSLGTRDGRPFEGTLVIGEDTAWTPVEGDLTPELQGRITITPESFSPGDTLTIDLPEGHERERVYVVAFSEPTALGEATVEQDRIAVTTPSSLRIGMHRIAVYDEAGELIGWDAAMAVPAGSNAGDAGDSTGTADDGGGALAATGMSVTLLVVLAIAAAAAVLVGSGIVRARRASRS